VGVAAANPDFAAASALLAREFGPAFGRSTAELTVSLGEAWWLRAPPARRSVESLSGGITVAYSADATRAALSWAPPLLLNASDVSSPRWNSTATPLPGLVTYSVYMTPRTFSDSAARHTNTSAGFVAVVPTTACGLERWAALTGRAAQVLTTTATAVTVTGLVPGAPYEVNVVASCSEDCLRASAAALGWPDIPNAVEAQRAPYAVTALRTTPLVPRNGVPDADDAFNLSPSTAAAVLAPIGVVLAVILAAGVLFLLYRQHVAQAAADAAKLAGAPPPAAAAAGDAPGIAGVSSADIAAARAAAAASPAGASPAVPREQADALFKPRDPSVRRAVFGAAAVAHADAGIAAAAASAAAIAPSSRSLAAPFAPVAAGRSAHAGFPVADAGAGVGAGAGRGRAARGGAARPQDDASAVEIELAPASPSAAAGARAPRVAVPGAADASPWE
jgi:hypothetical protein